MRKPTDEQKAVLESTARVRVVRATPGSGKTWLVAELIREELSKWPTKTSGIAALSFTRVGGNEIRKAVGHELSHPHFVGTIDAFMFRYVVRPFLRYCSPSFASPRLVPGEWGAEHWGKYAPNRKTIVGPGINLFGCVFIGEEAGKSVVAHKHPAQPLRQLGGDELTQVEKAKEKMWERSGCLTHSDAALWASKILADETLGATVRSEIVQRFPLIIVDELQDTGYFLGKSILLLLDGPVARGVLVGDPDQAIYEFNGARPDLFNRFESIAGAVKFPLANSQRCASAVANAAGHLKESGGKIGPADGKTGRAFLVRYGDMPADIPRLLGAITAVRSDGTVKVIARQISTVEALIGRSAKPVPKLGCPPLNHMQRAVVAFQQCRQVAAVAAARAALGLALFEHEGVDDAGLEDRGIEPSRWKRLVVDCLLRACAEAATGSLYDWQERIGQMLDGKIMSSGLSVANQHVTGKLKPKHMKKATKPCVDYLPQSSAAQPDLFNIPVQTVHGVKGETHEVTILVCPTIRADHCPSAVWWSADHGDREERRIAYVAMTRTQGDLIVCVSDACYQRLCTSRKPFVESFECLTVDDYIAALRQNVGSNPTSSPAPPALRTK